MSVRIFDNCRPDMKLEDTTVVRWISGWMGYLLCEIAFRMDERVSGTQEELGAGGETSGWLPDSESEEWRWYHAVFCRIFGHLWGSLIDLGCWFYELSAWGFSAKDE